MNIPKPHSLWRHHKGDTYVVIEIANTASNDINKFPLMVIYRKAGHGDLWARPLTEWNAKFTLMDKPDKSGWAILGD